MNFLDLLYSWEGVLIFLLYMHNVLDIYLIPESDDGATLGTLLAFYTGAEYPPSLGFHPAAIRFSPAAEFPTSSTCALELTLPTKYHDRPDVFCERMLYALVVWKPYKSKAPHAVYTRYTELG